MPSNGLPKRTIRTTDELWDAFVQACPGKDLGGAAEVLRQFMAWYARHDPAARMPRRPA